MYIIKEGELSVSNLNNIKKITKNCVIKLPQGYESIKFLND